MLARFPAEVKVFILNSKESFFLSCGISAGATRTGLAVVASVK